MRSWPSGSNRLSWFINEILEISIRALPREVRRKWKGSGAVDATVIPAFAWPALREKRKKKGVTPPTLRYSTDPDADWYHRERRDTPHGDSETRFAVWGYRATLMVSGNDEPGKPSAVPSMVMGMAPLHKPGTEVGQNAVRALRSICQRGHPTNFLAGDRAYTQATPEHFQLSARALGYDLVLDYKIDQLGLQGSYEGMNLVDGTWYCPAMPTAQVNATLDFRNDLIDEGTYADRIKERRAYQRRPKARPDADGHTRMRCPASTPTPLVRCELKPGSEAKAPA